MNLKRARQHKIHQQIQKVPEDTSTMYYFAGSLILHGSMELAMLVKGIVVSFMVFAVWFTHFPNVNDAADIAFVLVTQEIQHIYPFSYVCQPHAQSAKHVQ
jgi:hypothetical protein